jgi:Transposase DDE domain
VSCIQAATDKKHKLFVHADIGALDKRQLAPMALAVKQLLDLRAFNSLSDVGYSSGDQLQICKSTGIITYSAPMRTTAPSYNCIPTSEFAYDKLRDCYICTAGNVLNKVGNYTQRNTYKAFMYKTRACETCSIRQECTKNKMGRIIERTEYQDVIDENKERVRKNKDYYKLRQQIVEHQFGILKRQWGFSFTLMRGKQNVLSEVYLLMITYNLKRIISVLGGVKAFSQRLKDFGATGIILHIILISSVLTFAKQKISGALLDFIQLINASTIIVVPWLGAKIVRCRKCWKTYSHAAQYPCMQCKNARQFVSIIIELFKRCIYFRFKIPVFDFTIIKNGNSIFISLVCF